MSLLTHRTPRVIVALSWLLFSAAAACECDPIGSAGVCTPGEFRCVDDDSGDAAIEQCDCGRRGGEITGCRYPSRWERAPTACAPEQMCIERDDGKAAACVDNRLGPCTTGITPERCVDSNTALQCVYFIGPPVGGGENQPGILSEVSCEPGFRCAIDNGFAVCIMD